jgi:hypothetical protein
VKAATNKRQVVIALTGGELVYFELDNQGQLNEYQERKEMASNVTCLSVGEVPEGRQRSRFLVKCIHKFIYWQIGCISFIYLHIQPIFFF